MSRTESEIDVIRQRHKAACEFPGVLDEELVERELAAFLQALGVSRQIVRLKAGWRLKDHPPIQRNVERILDEWVRLDRDALAVHVAFEEDAARNAVPAGQAGDDAISDARDRRAASDAAVACDAFADDIVPVSYASLSARDAAHAAAARDVDDAIFASKVRFSPDLSTYLPPNAVRAVLDGLSRVGALPVATLQRFAAWCIHTGSWDLSCDAIDTVLGAHGAVAWADRLFDAYVCGCWLVYWTNDVLYWTAKPAVHLAGPILRLHHDRYAAIESDVENLYFWHGVMVPAFVVVRPDWITVDHIDRETNTEVRRIMIERYRHGQDIRGAAAFLRDAGAERLDHDARYGTLWRRAISGDEPVVMIEVVNATREPDGRFKRYWLRVPPDMTSARAAAAWTFGLPAQEYAPVKET
jgi:hypothetical protein